MLYIMRHGQTDWNLGNKIQGVSDIPLNESGLTQATDAAQFFAQMGDCAPRRIISSDLMRAAQTANIVGQRLNITVEYDLRLREYVFGTLEGKTLASVNKETMTQFNPAVYNAEAFEDAFYRITGFLQEIDFDKNILVVSHGGIMRFGMYYLNNGLQFDIKRFMGTALKEHIGNTGVIRIASQNSGFEKIR